MGPMVASGQGPSLGSHYAHGPAVPYHGHTTASFCCWDKALELGKQDYSEGEQKQR